jgi:predicted lipoprotein
MLMSKSMKMVGKYILIVAVFALLLYRGIYFENLQDVRQQQQREAFNAAEYARDFWLNQLPGVLDKAVDVKELIKLFNTDMAKAIEHYGKAPGVSRVYAYLLKGEGTILEVNESGFKVSVEEPHTNPDVLIEIGSYIPGNAVRDASDLIDVSKFTDTMKFNEISGEINKIVVKDVIEPFLDKGPGTGRTVKFFGATQVAQDAAEENGLGLIKIVPIRLQLE